MLVDVHFHPTDPAIDSDCAGLLERARAAGVCGGLATGYDLDSSRRVVELAVAFPELRAAVGFHPWYLEGDLNWEELAELAGLPQVAAVGEIGLDGAIEMPMERQEEWFRRQLELAVQLDKPVIIHSRRAVERVLNLVAELPRLRGLLHSFSGGPEIAARFLDLGFFFSFSGSVTRSAARRGHRLARYLPADRIMVETDAPSIGIEGVAEGAVEPCHLPLVVAALASLRGESPESLAATTTANAHRLLGMAPPPPIPHQPSTILLRPPGYEGQVNHRPSPIPRSPGWLERTAILLGSERVGRLSRAHIAVFGLGGVGGAAVEALARSGVGRLTLLDVDVFSESNLNRQLLALRSSLGRPKVEVARERVLAINPECRVDSLHRFFQEESAEELLTPRPDLVIDAIDGLNAKVGLIDCCLRRQIPVITACGAGRRLDPTQVRHGPITQVTHDPLTALVRRRLRRRGWSDRLSELTAVYSLEHPTGGLYAAEAGFAASEEQGRGRIPLGSMACVPNTAGFTAAWLAIEMALRCEGSDRGLGPVQE